MAAADRRAGVLREPCRAADGRKLVFLFADDAREQADQTRLLESFGYAVRVSKNPGSVSGGFESTFKDVVTFRSASSPVPSYLLRLTGN